MMRALVPSRSQLLLLALALFARPGGLAAQQRDFDKVTIKTTPVAGPIAMLEGAGGNIGVSAGPDGILIVDDQFAPLAPKIRAALAALRKGAPGAAQTSAPGSVDFVLNTHWHRDHTSGNPVFGLEAPIIAHAKVRERLKRGGTSRGGPVEPAPAEAWPVITFDEGLTVHFNGEDIRVRHFPAAHTDGDAVVFFTGSKVIHMGDIFFAGRFPFVDLDSGGSVAGMIAAVAAVLADAPPGARIIPGHGPLSDLVGLRAYHHMLTETEHIVRSRVEAAATLAAAQAEGLPEEWGDWGRGPIDAAAWIETIYRSVERERAAAPAAEAAAAPVE